MRHPFNANASQYHKKIGELLTNSPEFMHHKVVQEYPVNKVNPDWHSSRHRFDWAILDLFVVIEIHGEQHYKPWTKGVSTEEAVGKLEANQLNDTRKKNAALDAGWRYISIPYWIVGKLTASSLLSQISELPSLEIPVIISGRYKKPDKSKAKIDQLERARQFRRARYLAYKERLKAKKEECDEC